MFSLFTMQVSLSWWVTGKKNTHLNIYSHIISLARLSRAFKNRSLRRIWPSRPLIFNGLTSYLRIQITLNCTYQIWTAVVSWFRYWIYLGSMLWHPSKTLVKFFCAEYPRVKYIVSLAIFWHVQPSRASIWSPICFPLRIHFFITTPHPATFVSLED